MTLWAHDVWDANELLLDRLIVDIDGEPVGMVDDLELKPGEDGGPPILTALLCGPTAFGPRLGDRIGTWWLAVGRRMRPLDDPYPIRIPIEAVGSVDRKEVKLTITREMAGTRQFADWVRDHVISRLPGGMR